MAKSVKLSHSDELRESSRQQVFDAIREAGQIARIDIAQVTRISPATVTAITADLIAAGLIEEVSPDISRGAKRGRPRVALKIRGDAHTIAGMKLSHHAITTLITDFEGAELVCHEIPLPGGQLDPDALCEKIVTALDESCAQGGLERQQISGLAIGMAGVMDADRNFVYWSSSLNVRNIDFGSYLARYLSIPVFIDNDANLVAKAELLFGEGDKRSNFVVVTVEHGVGMGIVIDNQIYRGARGCGAEFGHTKVQLEGALCQCGQRGCLEAYVGDYALLREANVTSGVERHKDLASLYAAREAGDIMAQSTLDRAGRMFAMGLANVVNIFDPQMILLAGAQLAFGYLSSDKVVHEMRRSVLQVDGPLPEVRVHGWGNKMWAKGAAAHAIEEISALRIREVSGHAG
ncbi:ROK family transcriptional regulator [Phaeobacter italicus]|uniref:ROK family transcriptional regulator n=1 Tax=Phaeobacter italicus TaxID=481446 RepID=UPI001CD391ED|nr:ROK family transcriptional regulator [Phaeobacter italicus]MCA0858968.1 ROK family protein [Phaeobacter italicus]